jgi:hypothetical protein
MPIEIRQTENGKSNVFVYGKNNIKISLYDFSANEEPTQLMVITEMQSAEAIGKDLTDPNVTLEDELKNNCVVLHFKKIRSVEAMIKILNRMKENMKKS